MAFRPQEMMARKAVEIMKHNGGNRKAAMIEAGYSPTSARSGNIVKGKIWSELIDKEIGDKFLAKEHKNLIKAGKLTTEQFPMGPKDEAQKAEWLERDRQNAIDKGLIYNEQDYLTDKDIIDMFAEANCNVRRIVRGDAIRMVYYIAPDNRTKKDAVEMAYKIKGRYQADTVVMPIQPNVDTENAVFNVLNVFMENNRSLDSVSDELLQNNDDDPIAG